MTPEQIAERVVSGHAIKTLCPIANPAMLTATIAQVIRDAYERAATEVEKLYEERESWEDRHLLTSAAARIRELKGETT